MRLPTVALSILATCLSVQGFAKNPLSRPKIFGITSVTFCSNSLPAARDFYAKTVDPLLTCLTCAAEAPGQFVARLPIGQSVLITKSTNDTRTSLLVNVTFITENVQQLAKFLKFNNIEFKWNQARDSLSVADPEGDVISFVGPPRIDRITEQDAIQLGKVAAEARKHPHIPKLHLIHAGFVVHDRAAMDKFYKDLLGFRLYWHGGMKDGTDDWVDMQVPDGTDWIEYMLNVPANADKRELGVMNHIALGVPDIHEAEKQLIKNGWKPGEKPEIGRDGKWQLNLYDPDGTRVELMEFTPVQKPCCSDYTGPHPGQKRPQ